MTSNEAQAGGSVSQLDGQAVDACPACGHPTDAHDRIALRFCDATTAGTFQRGCVCTALPESAKSD